MNTEHVYNSPITNPTLAITSGGTVETFAFSAFLYKIDSKIYSVAAELAQQVPASFVVDAGQVGALTVLIDAAGVISFEESPEVIAEGGAFIFDITKFSREDKEKAVVGFIVVANGAVTQWVGDTDDFDAAGVVTSFISNYAIIGL